ncbi:MAG: hypothetical protein ACXWT1_03565 [Methylobacter sp.]
MTLTDQHKKILIVTFMLGLTSISAALPLWLLWHNAASANATVDLAFISRFFFRAFILCGVPVIYWLEAWAYLHDSNAQSSVGKTMETLASLVLLCLASNSLMGFFCMADEQYIRTLTEKNGVDVMRFGVAIVEPFPKLYFPLGVMTYAFWGAFVYNNYSFIRRLRSNDFAPPVFVAGALRLVLAVLAAGLLYYAMFLDVYNYTDTGNQVLAVKKSDHALGAGWLVVGAFFAGLYPQQMISAIFSWFYARVTQLVPSLGKFQYTPMTILQGVTLDVELRLKEEGIDSLQALAVCNVADLANKLPYSVNTISDWQDQAKLAVYFSDGEQFAALASLGIRSYSALKNYQNNIKADPVFADALKLVDPSPIAKDKFQHFVRFGVFP